MAKKNKKKKEIIPFIGEDMEQQNSHTLLVGMYIGKKNHFAKLGVPNKAVIVFCGPVSIAI